MCISITPALTSGVFTILGSSFFLQNSRVIFFQRHVDVHCDCAGGNKTDVPCLGLGFFSCTRSHNLSCGMSMCISIGQARTKRGSLSWGATFSCKFLRCHALLRCPCAFRLHRLAQSLLCGGFTILVPGFFLFLHTTAPCACQLTCLCACRLRMLARSLRCGVLKLLVCGIFIVNSRVNGLLWG